MMSSKLPPHHLCAVFGKYPALMMKDSTMTSWEEGVFELNYFKFTKNKPYSPPFTFKATLRSGQEVEGQNVINSMDSGDSGTLSEDPKNDFVDTSVDTNCWWIWVIIPLVLFTVSMAYVVCKIRSSATISAEDEPPKSETTNPETTVNGEGAEGMKTDETTIEVTVQSPKRVSHPAQLNPFDPESRQYLEWK